MNQKSKDAASDRLDTLQKVEALHISGATHVVAASAGGRAAVEEEADG